MADEKAPVVLERRRDGAVEILTLNRPERRNALNGELVTALGSALAELEADAAVQAIVLTGAGDRAFCSGMDLKDSAAQDLTASLEPSDSPSRHWVLPWDYPKPIVGAINGAAVAGGFELMMACDIIVAADHAIFQMAEVKRGLIPAGGGTLLGTRVPIAIAMEMLLTGDPLSAERAFSIGLVNQVVPAADLISAALAVATRIAENGPLAIGAVKQLVRDGSLEGPAAAWPSDSTLARIFGSEDAREGPMAFVEKRAPRWVGR